MKILTAITAIVISIISAGLITAQSPEQNTWSPEFSFSLGRITETNISANARYVAYVVRKAQMADNKSEYVSQIHVAAVDGSFDRPFTFGEKSNYFPRFSSDGSMLAFLSNRTGTAQVFVMPVDGGEARQVTHALSSISYFKWSPDDSRIAWLMTDQETEEEKQKKKAGTDIELVDHDLKYRHIFVREISPAGGASKVKQITSGQINVNEFDWSPDGKTIVFSHQPDPEINTSFIQSDISLVPSDSGTITGLVDWPGVDRTPIFSPNGKLIAFSSQGGKPEPIGLQDLYTIPVNGGKPERLALSPDRNVSLIGWAPDGKALYFSELAGTCLHLFAVQSKGDNMAVVTLNNRPLLGKERPGTPEGSIGTWGKFSVAKTVGHFHLPTRKPGVLKKSFIQN